MFSNREFFLVLASKYKIYGTQMNNYFERKTQKSAGINLPPPRKWTREEILNSLRDVARNTGRPPSTRDPEVQKLVRVAKKEFGSWQHALRVAGLQTYKEWRSRHSLSARIKNFLKNNPSTFAEMKKELQDCSDSALISRLKLCKDIESIGPRRKKVYFLVGQEDLAQKKLEKVLGEVDPMMEIIFDLLKEPMTYKQLEANAKLRAEIEGVDFLEKKVSNAVRILRMAGIIYKAKFTRSGAHGGTKYSCFEIFGSLANKIYYCRYDCPREMATFLSDLLPKATTEGLRCALTHQLKRILPRDVFESLM